MALIEYSKIITLSAVLTISLIISAINHVLFTPSLSTRHYTPINI